jgi:hypothetical protein
MVGIRRLASVCRTLFFLRPIITDVRCLLFFD